MTGPYSVAMSKEEWDTPTAAITDAYGRELYFVPDETEAQAWIQAQELCDALNRDHALRTRRVQDPCLVDGQRDHGVGLRITEVADV